MACVDILSQLVPVVDDPFANWIKFEDDVDNITFNYYTSTKSKPIKNDPFDIFSILNDHKNDEKDIDEKHMEVKKDTPTLLDLTKIPSNISSLFSDKKNSKPKLCQLYHQTNKSNQISLNIVGLNINTDHDQTLRIKNEQYTFSNIATNLTQYNTVKDLTKFIRKTYKINTNIGILMIYSHSVLLNKHNTLKSYGICNNSCIFIAICEDLFKFNSFILSNDNSADDFAKAFNMLSNDYLQFEHLQSQILNNIHRYQMQGFKCKTITDLDILTYERVTNCIEMPCGHGMTIDALYSYTQSELNSKKMFIKCPHIHGNNEKCNQIWYFPIIRYILMESKQFKMNDIIKLELLSSVNTFNEYYQHSKCPNCKHNLYKHLCDDKNRTKSHCPLCINTFCWKCCQLWNDKTSQIFCGNKNCDNFEREVYKILSECPLKTIGSVSSVPSIRLCPKCSQLINHTEACKHMNCNSCKLNFCFVCLKPMINDEWQCGSSGGICPIAPIQTEDNINKGKLKDTNPLLEILEEIENADTNPFM